jgi:hypothetical protein
MGIASLHPSYESEPSTTRPLADHPAILRPHSRPLANQMVYGTFNSAPYSLGSAARTGLKRSG